MVAKLTTKGQLTIPREIRERLNLQTGDRVHFVINEQGRVEMLPLQTRLKDLKGALPKPAKAVSLNEMEAAIIEEGGKI